MENIVRESLAMMKRIGAIEERGKIVPLLHEMDKTIACIGGFLITPQVPEELSNMFCFAQEEFKRILHEIEQEETRSTTTNKIPARHSSGDEPLKY